jgi:acyl-CoA dehydrogenase
MIFVIQHDYYNKVLDPAYDRRRMENDAMTPDSSERCYTDEDMQAVFGDL